MLEIRKLILVIASIWRSCQKCGQNKTFTRATAARLCCPWGLRGIEMSFSYKDSDDFKVWTLSRQKRIFEHSSWLLSSALWSLYFIKEITILFYPCSWHLQNWTTFWIRNVLWFVVSTRSDFEVISMSARGKSSFLAVGNASLWLPCHAQILPRSLLHLMMIPQLILPKLISSKFL